MNDRTINMPMVKLNDGREMPQLGFGTLYAPNNDTPEMVRTALDVGYRLVDTARIYENEEGVGEALAGRDDVWLTTKIWNTDQGYDSARTAFEDQLKALRKEAVDLLLIHWPCPQQDKFVDTWRALIELRKEGTVRSIGVSNFLPEHLDAIVDATGVVPAVNQIELHPRYQQRELVARNSELNIVTQAWSPLGQGRSLSEETIIDIARDLESAPATIVIAWHLAKGHALFPKASSRRHMEANMAALELQLSEEQVAQIDALDRPGGGFGPDPRSFYDIGEYVPDQ